jgi:hypothetical protein
MVMKSLMTSVLAVAALAQPAPQVFTGTITDSMCSNANHASMRMGPTDPECTMACVEEHDASLVLFDGKQVFELSDQKAARKFAGRKAKITGTLDAKSKTIRVTSIAAGQ